MTLYDESNLTSAAKTLINEQKMLSEEICHPNIVKAFRNTTKWDNVIILEMELGLETVESFVNRVSLTESQCASIMKGVFLAL